MASRQPARNKTRLIQLSIAIHGAINDVGERLSPGHRTYRGSRSADGPRSSQVAGELQITARRPSTRSPECVASRAGRMDECLKRVCVELY